jgi:hypothetical protein
MSPRLLRLASLACTLAAPALLHAQAADSAKKNYEFSGNLGFAQTGGNADLMALNSGNKYKYVMNGWTFAQDLRPRQCELLEWWGARRTRLDAAHRTLPRHALRPQRAAGDLAAL